MIEPRNAAPEQVPDDPAIPGRAAQVRRRLGILVAILGLAYLFHARIDWHELGATLAACNWRLVPLILGAQVGFVTLGSFALWLLVSGRQPMSFRVFLVAYWRAAAVGYWTPAAAGEASLVWFLRSHGLRARDGLALIAIDKTITTLVLALAALPVAGSVASRLREAGPRGWVLPAALLGVSSLVLVVAWMRRAPWAVRLFGGIRLFLESLRALTLASPPRLAVNVGLTAVRTTIGAAALGLSIAAFTPLEVTALPRLLVGSSAARLLALAVPSPSGLGVYEASLVELLAPATAPAAAVFSGALLSRLLALPTLGLGWVFRATEAPAAGAGNAPEQP